MKTINRYFMMLAGLFALTFASCDDGNIGAIYTPDADEKGYTFLAESTSAEYKPAYTDTVFNVKIARNFTNGEQVVPILVEGADPLFVIPTEVTFADGQGSVNIPIGIEGMATGETYEFTLAIDTSVVALAAIKADSVKYNIEGIVKCEVSLTVDYSWTKAGTVVINNCDWAGGEVNKEVDIEYAPEYVDADGNLLYRLNNWMYVSDPDYSDPGYHLQFLLEQDTYNTVAVPQIQPIGQFDSSYGNFYYVFATAYGSAFTNDHNVYTLDCLIGYDKSGSSISLGWYETLIFTWSEGYPGELPPAGDEEGAEGSEE